LDAKGTKLPGDALRGFCPFWTNFFKGKFMDRTLSPCLPPADRNTRVDICLYLGADLATTHGGAACGSSARIPGQINTARRMLTREEKVARIMAQQQAAGLRDSAKPVLRSRDGREAGDAGLLQPIFSAATRIVRAAEAVADALIPRFPGASAAEDASLAQEPGGVKRSTAMAAGLKPGPLDDGATVKEFSASAQALGLQVQVSRNFLPGGPDPFPPTFPPDTTRLNGLPLFIQNATGGTAAEMLIAAYARPGDFIVTTDPHISRDLKCFDLVEAGHCTLSGYCDKQVQQAAGVDKNGTARTFILLSPAEAQSLMSVIGPGNRNASFDFVWAGASPLPTPPFSNSQNCKAPPDPLLKKLEDWTVGLTAAGGVFTLLTCIYRVCCKGENSAAEIETMRQEQQLINSQV
jgi:hypothetical protein